MDTLEWLTKLVAFRTSACDSNLDLIHEIERYLEDLGFTCQKSYDDDEKKANLLATIGDPERAGVMLSGHTDVVPVEGQKWNSDPYRVIVSNGRAYGRGTCDMKGFLAVILALAPELARASQSRTFHLAFSYDEEIGCVGARRLVPAITNLPRLPRACIVGEPTSMLLFVGHKGKTSYRVRVRGCECHSSTPLNGVNAVEIGARLISTLGDEAAMRREQKAFPSKFDPPYTTIHTGLIRGGTALNIVPKECYFEFEIRNLPGDDTADVLTRLSKQCDALLLPRTPTREGIGVDIEVRSSYPGLMTPEDHPLVIELADALGQGEKNYASFGTEGGLFSEIGIPTVILGPGSIQQAHKPDEFVDLSQLVLCQTTLKRLLIERSVAA